MKSALALFPRIGNYFRAHKGMAVAILIVIIGAGYYGYGKLSAKEAATRYVLGAVTRGTLLSTVSGTGQVEASDQVDLKPDVSGTVLSVNAAEGDSVKEGQVIASIDPGDAALTVKNAELSLEASQLALQKLENPTGSNLLQAQDAVTSAVEAKTTTENSIVKAYSDGFSDTGSAVQDLTDAMNDMESILYDTNHSPYMADAALRGSVGQSALDDKQNSGVKFDAAKDAVQSLTAAYRVATRDSDHATIENLVSEAYAASQQVSDAAKDLKTTLDHIQAEEATVPSQLAGDQTTVAGDLTKVNGEISTLFSIKNTLSTSQQSLDSADRAIAEKQQALSDITEPEQSDVASAELDVETKQAALQDAQKKLADYTVRAPFDGVVATLDVKKGDTISSSAVATLITTEQVATVSLNELDAAKVKVGDKATLTFDAVPDLSISGQVIAIDALGTVSQGVVTYNVKIGFDTQDERVKPGMSVTADIITDAKPDVLLVPTTAVKTAGGQSFVEELPGVASGAAGGTATAAGVTSGTPPVSIPVTVGDSNDSQTEIVSGLNEGDTIVMRTIAVTQTQTGTASGAGTGAARAGGGAAFFGGAGAARGNVQFIGR